MTAPSSMLATIANKLGDELGVELVKGVRIHDGAFGDDDKDFVTLPGDPALLVACLGANDAEDYDDAPFYSNAVFAVWCISRTRNAQNVRAGVAMDLAFRVHSIVKRAGTWGFALKAPERIRVINEHSKKLSNDKGLSVWSVSWTQLIPEDFPPPGEIRPLGTIHFTLAQGDENTPDAEAQIDF